MSRLESARRIAGVTDRDWSPPQAPEDNNQELLALPLQTGYRSKVSAWPDWVGRPGGYPLDSPWLLTCRAQIVVPEHCHLPTLALVDEADPPDCYTVAAGTRLTLVETYDTETDESTARETDPHILGMFYDGWATRIYSIEDGPSAGIKVTLPADPGGHRFPLSSLRAHAAVRPANPEKGS